MTVIKVLISYILMVDICNEIYIYSILYQPFVFDPRISCFLHDVDENHT